MEGRPWSCGGRGGREALLFFNDMCVLTFVFFVLRFPLSVEKVPAL